MLTLSQILTKYRVTILLLSAIIAGSMTGLTVPDSSVVLGEYVDITILVLVFLIFLEVPYEKLAEAAGQITFISVTWITNFIIIPLTGFGIAYLFLGNQPLLFVGLLIYFMSPCTDWFLAFTKIANGDTATGSILIPINMISQLLLYPVYLFIFANRYASVPLTDMMQTLVNWFLWPFLLAIILHVAIKKVTTVSTYERIQHVNTRIIEGVLTLLVFIIFAANIATINQHITWFSVILIAVFVFFVLVYLLTERISHWLNFSYSRRVLYTMTTSARNAPLMLAVTIAAFPDQPLIYAAIIIGMLVEFPHLTVISTLISRDFKTSPLTVSDL